MSIVSNAEFLYLKTVSFFRKLYNLFQSENIEDNVTTVVYRALQHHKIKVTLTSVTEYLKTHQNYPSFKSICDFFEENNVQNYALRYDESDLYDLNYPFIAHLKESGGKVIFVYSVNKEHIVYTDSLIGKKIMSKSEFHEKWDGAVIVIEPTELSGEADYNEKRKTEIINSSLLPVLIFAFSMTIIYGIIFNKPFSSGIQGTGMVILLITHFAGFTFSILLLRQELNLKTKFTDKLCHIATNADCDAVTKSKASKIFGSITWADAGVAYFIGGLISLFLTPLTSTLNLLLVFSIAALPYPVFSILYQWLKIKKWCPFCISVQIVIIIEAVLAFKFLNMNELSYKFAFPVCIIFLVIFLIVLLIKFLFLSEREKIHSRQELLKLKREPEIFLYKLQKGERIEIPYDKYALIFGDDQSEVLISVFLSFHCSACAKIFDAVQKLIEKNYKIKVQLILSPPKDEMSEKLSKTIFRLMIAGQNNKILEELYIWYKTGRSERNKLYPGLWVNNEVAGFEDMIGYNSMLFKTGKIVAVPSVYVNGYPLPSTYSLDDIRYHISELKEMQPKLNEIEV